MYYYQYNQNAMLVEKGNAPFSTNGACSDLDFDLSLYDVVVSGLREDGWILRWSTKEKPVGELVRSIKELRTSSMEQQQTISALESQLAAINTAIERGLA